MYKPEWYDILGVTAIIAITFALVTAICVIYKLYRDEQQKTKYLRESLEKFSQNVSMFPAYTGICCCGSPMDAHEDAYNCGHAPTDQWDYFVLSLSVDVTKVLGETK